MVLIMSLSKQLRGEVTFSREGGTAARFRFPLRSRDASLIPVDPEPKEQ
jgi:two-component sensor histidine kinase